MLLVELAGCVLPRTVVGMYTGSDVYVSPRSLKRLDFFLLDLQTLMAVGKYILEIICSNQLVKLIVFG